MTVHALVLFAHGSRDPQWRAPIEAVAERASALSPGLAVRCAYLELTEPDLPTVAAELAAQGIQHVRICPMFLGVGKHAREDLPQLVRALRQSYPAMQVQLMPSVGEMPSVLDTLAQVAVREA
jgi:sirohydrochlorin cobaltochelatase